MKIKFLTLMAVLSQNVFAEPTSQAVTITSIRSLGNETYISIDDTRLCDTNVFWLKGDYPGAKQIVATALTAFALNKKITLEIRTDTGCTGWGTKIMGLTMLK
jgi:hypothetical protein